MKEPILLVEDREADVLLTIRALKKNNIANDVVLASDEAVRQLGLYWLVLNEAPSVTGGAQ